MNIIAYQTEDGICRFIYNVSQGSFHVVSVENYGGMYDFLKYSGATKLSNNANIHQYAKELEEYKTV
jgi:hypothetical protein